MPNTPLTSTSTIDLIQECIDEGGDVHPKKFWSKIAHAVLGYEPSSEQFCDFWQAVAFYNYIQESVGFRAKGNRPTSVQWKAATTPFDEVLADLKPDCILVLGETLWRYLSQAGRNGSCLTLGNQSRCTWLYSTGSDTTALASQIKHPSARSKWDPMEWHPWISALMEGSKHRY